MAVMTVAQELATEAPVVVRRTARPALRVVGPDERAARPARTWERTTDRTTAQLLEAAREREPGAFEELVQRYERYVRSLVRGFRLSSADEGDAVQMTWLRLIENLDRIRDPERLGGWLATTARRECLQIARRAAREVDGAEERLASRPDERFPSPEGHVVQEAMTALLREYVAALPAKEQDLLWALTATEKPAYAELSARTGMPLGSIGPTRGRYLKRLRKVLEDAGLGADAWR